MPQYLSKAIGNTLVTFGDIPRVENPLAESAADHLPPVEVKGYKSHNMN